MKNYFFALLVLSFSATAFAESTLDCANTDNIGRDEDKLEECVTHTNKALNAAYDELKSRHEDNKEMQGILKDMQLGWIKMRDAQCLYRSMNTGSGAALTGVLCEIELTHQRSEALAEL